jgi:hypothetical protein
MYVLPNRKAFADSITRIFIRQNARDVGPFDDEDKDVDLCLQRTGSGRELFPYQKLVRDYLLAETPYRGLLLYHGLGSGKTCSSIAVAESLLNTKKIFVMLPASLAANFKSQLRQCGDSIYQQEQYWEVKPVRGSEDREQAKGFGISDTYLDKYGRFFTTVAERPPNWSTLPRDVQKGIQDQISDIIDQRFTFINYNGINKSNIDSIFPPDQPQMFDNSVIIIDEAHNFIGTVINESVSKTRIYDMIYKSKNTKLVLLSGTPIINAPNEISYMMNLLRGPIEVIQIPTTQVISWDEGMMSTFFRSLPEVDTIDYNSVKRIIKLTRNPQNFETVYNEKQERIAVKFNKDLDYEPDILLWTNTWRDKFQAQFNGTELAAADKCIKEELECLPTKFEDFINTFVDGLKIKNAMMFQRRIQGLVSYFKGSDERLLPKRIDTEHELIKIPMSGTQFLRYLEVRWKEIQMDSRRGRTKTDLGDNMGSYRTNSRLTCNYAIPPEFVSLSEDATSEQTVPDKEEILTQIRADPKRFLSREALVNFSPKLLKMLDDLKSNVGELPNFKNQFVYSYFRSLEGSGLFSAILEYNGFQEYKLKKTQGTFEEDPSMKPGIPAYAFFRGGEDATERDYYRQIFNGDYEDNFPSSLKESIKEKRLCILLASKAGAEGINLKNVRNVYITESHWNPALLDQVIGRAIRICSHAKLPILERTVKVNVYLTVFNKDQETGTEGPNIVLVRRNDMVLKRYDVEQPMDTFMTTDEYLYEISYEKGRIAKSIFNLLKQSAIDCEIHRKLHSRNGEVIQCMRFDTTSTNEDLTYKSNYLTDERDTLYLRNIERKTRRLQRIRVKGIDMILDPDTNDIFDANAFEDNSRLLKIGIRSTPTEIKWFTI